MFCKTRNTDITRTGKIVDVDESKQLTTVEFLGPTEQDIWEEDIPTDEVEEYLLEENTRVYLHDDKSNTWKVGYLLFYTSLGKLPFNFCLVKKKQLRTILFLCTLYWSYF